MNRRAIQVIDLGFGDSGKGAMVDHLVRRHAAELVVRFNGGPQAGHNVVTPEGRHHTFAQFGSGSFMPAVRTLLSRFMLVEPYAMVNEAAHLTSVGVADVMSRTIIDERCLVIAPPQQIMNRIRERSRGDAAHGTCGMGVGECMADCIAAPAISLLAGDLHNRSNLRRKLVDMFEYTHAGATDLRAWATAEELRVLDDPGWIDTALGVYEETAQRARILPADRINRILREAACVIFEGAQGVLLDERYGFHPHTTWSSTTFENADALLDESVHQGERRRIGVMRTYMTRHGSGPLVSYDEELQQRLAEPHNNDNGFQGRFRRGVLDLVMLRYAIDACGNVDELAVTHLDQLNSLPGRACSAYEMDGRKRQSIPLTENDGTHALTQRISRASPVHQAWPVENEDATVAAIENALGISVLHRSRGPRHFDKTSSKAFSSHRAGARRPRSV